MRQGEELFADYGYTGIDTKLPWYTEMYEKHLKENGDMGNLENSSQ